MMRAREAVVLLGLGLGLGLGLRRAQAWELETHVGLTHQAALHGRLDAWLRARGLGSGLYETLALQPEARRPPHDGDRFVLDDRALLDELATLDAALGVSPDGTRQPALSWLLAGAALEGARMDRVRNHFIGAQRGAGERRGGLAEDSVDGSARLRLGAARDGSGSVRGLFTGANFDGTGVRADRWIDSPDNTLSRARLVEELERADTAATPAARQAALARALICLGAITHVLQAVGDPAHARGDFSVNYLGAGAPLERWALQRYGRSVPGPAAGTHAVDDRFGQLAHFLTSPDGTGLGDEIARTFVSPGTLPGTPGALPEPALQAGAAAEGTVAGAKVRVLAAYRRSSEGTTFSIPAQAVSEAAAVLLPIIARRSIELLDFALRGELLVDEDGGFRVGALALGPGHLTYLEDGLDGVRRTVISRDTPGGASGAVLLVGDHRARGVLVYRGVDAHGEPITVSASTRDLR